MQYFYIENTVFFQLKTIDYGLGIEVAMRIGKGF